MKKNILVLLSIPFVVNLLALVSVKTTYAIIDNEMIGIEWDYEELETLKLGGSPLLLSATPVAKKDFPLPSDDQLEWSITSGEDIVSIETLSGKPYLKAENVGEAEVMCSNTKKTVFRVLDVLVYENGTIIIQPKFSKSGSSITSTTHVGQYDLKDHDKVNASFSFNVKSVGIDYDEFELRDKSDNLSVSMVDQRVEILSPGESYITIGLKGSEAFAPVTYSFDVVEDGVNVYDYSDLMDCTNRSEEGEVMVLRKSFESYDNTYNNNGTKKSDAIECFGTPDANGKFDFSQDLYTFKTTYNHEYIDQWNEFCKTNSSYQPLSDELVSCLHVQKSVYGNGFSLNFNNACYPSEKMVVSTDDGNQVTLPVLGNNDLFRGPLPLYLLGNPGSVPLIGTYGQDNCGMYIDGKDITIDDVRIRNCDLGSTFSSLNTVGNVIDVKGENITIQNCIIANGRNVIRSASSTLTLENTLLQNGRNFLLNLTSDEYVKDDGSRVTSLPLGDGSGSTQSSLDTYLIKGGEGDSLMNRYLSTDPTNGDVDSLLQDMNTLQNALDYHSEELPYSGTCVVKDCQFNRSGIASIANENLFNGPFLYNGCPSGISDLFQGMEYQNQALVPLVPKNTSGIAYPNQLILESGNRFYDYKDSSTMDLSNLILENLSTIANEMQAYDQEITIDQFFPLKQYLYEDARQRGNTVSQNGKQYICIPVCDYGGGYNGSSLTLDDSLKDYYTEKYDLDLTSRYLNIINQTSGTTGAIRQLMTRMVLTVTGTDPFRFSYTEKGYLFDQNPDIADMKNHAKL